MNDALVLLLIVLGAFFLILFICSSTLFFYKVYGGLKKFWNNRVRFFNNLKRFNKVNLAKIFFPGYIFNKWVFRVGIFLILCWLFVASWSLGFSWKTNVYIHCAEKVNPCENPFYDPVGMNPTCLKYGICDRETLSPGESFGVPPGFFVIYARFFSLLMVLLMVLTNHFLYPVNKGYFKEPLRRFREGRL